MYKYADEVPVLTVDADPMAGSLSAGEDRETVEIPYAVGLGLVFVLQENEFDLKALER